MFGFEDYTPSKGDGLVDKGTLPIATESDDSNSIPGIHSRRKPN